MPGSGPQVIFATHRPPWPLDNGARIRTARLAQGLSRSPELTLVTFDRGPAWEQAVAGPAELEELLRAARGRQPAADRGYVEIEWRKVELEERRCR